MIRLIFSLLIISFGVKAQNAKKDKFATDSGIHFEKGLSWVQIKAKAKAENKYIFVDVYATWCGPCKQMDKYTYANDTVAIIVNKSFISLKAQIDTSLNDNTDTKKWYQDAHIIGNQYNVSAFPTFLFFSPEGEIVHKDIGAKNVNDFVKMADNAIDTNKQYFSLLKKYKENKIADSLLPYVAYMSKNFNDEKLAFRIASDYIRNYLNKLNERDFCTNKNLHFVNQFINLVRSNDPLFHFYLEYQDRIDSAIGIKDYSKQCIDDIITNEKITPLIRLAENNGTVPNWEEIHKNISVKYGMDIANRTLSNSKPEFYFFTKDWPNYAKYLVLMMDDMDLKKFEGIGGAYFLNNMAWEVFEYSKSNMELEKALVWTAMSLQLDTSILNTPNHMDTQANILYKLGRKDEAISLEEKAALEDPKEMNIRDNLIKMRRDAQTW